MGSCVSVKSISISMDTVSISSIDDEYYYNIKNKPIYVRRKNSCSSTLESRYSTYSIKSVYF
nr:putative ORF19 protein [Swinepox virus]AKL87982.1 putative ORF19 protein [Swinepox virus]AKL87985.1 putative ORF19 protein [Swinepox virus]AKL87988.1 putative ORF19 protein [Swinepox virus]AKL87991.1 putative ORF19 protein [Swinepox virus]